MSEPRRNQPTPADVLALATALERDEGLPAADVTVRDQRIGSAVADVTGKSADAVMALTWLDTVCAEDAVLRRHHQRVESLLAWTGLLTAAAGLVLGWAAAIAAFYYDGSGRVNALAVLAAFVFIPSIFLLLFIWAAVPPRLLAWLPGANAAGSLLRALSPGRVAGLVVRFLPRETRETWQQLTRWLGAGDAAQGSLRTWIVLRSSQLFALGFQTAALGAALALVVFSDLAFGWSTTLTTGDVAMDARRLTTITDTLATPWGGWFDGARPSAELIRDSRYFRATGGALSDAAAARLGGWWPFLMMAMLVYGLLPRLLTLLVAQGRVRSSARQAFLATPGLGPVLRRLHQARVKTVSEEPEYARAPGPAGSVAYAKAERATSLPSSAGAVINWSGVPVDDDRVSRRFGGAPVHQAGGAASPESDRSLGGRLAGSLKPDDGLVILVKAWEPPLMEFVDFVGDLRRACGRNRPITVVPVGVDGDDAEEDVFLHAPDPLHGEVWRRKLAAAGDPWLRMVAPENKERTTP